MRGVRNPRIAWRPRALVGAALLSAIVGLAPELTLAPLQAVEPHAAPRPVDLAVDADLLRRTRPLDDLRTAGGTLPPPARVPVPDPARDAAFQRALDAAREEALAFGVTFAAVRDGQLIWAGSTGVQRDERTPLAPDDEMVIGSVTKTFVAATVMQLIEEGRLSLGYSVRRILPEQRWLDTEVTVRQLLDHTSGLADVYNETTRLALEQHPERAWSSRAVFETLHEPWYKPGENWAYANTNYMLLGLIVERLTQATLESQLTERFLEPLRLEHTRMLTTSDHDGPLEPAWRSIFWASGAMAASAPDLARWGDALYGGSSIVDEATLEEMIEINDYDYGLGVQRIKVPDGNGYGHTGLLNAYTTLLLHVPAHDMTIAMLVNRTEVDLGAMLTAKPPTSGPSLIELVSKVD